MKSAFSLFFIVLMVTGSASAQSPDTVQAQKETVVDWYEAVGTVRPHTEARIEARITAQVMDVKVRPGARVEKGELLVSLDSRQFQSRLDQAGQGLKSARAGKKQAAQAVASAEAAFSRAQAQYKRIRTYFNSQAATEQQLEEAKAAYLQAKAELRRSREALEGTQAGIEQAQEMVKEAEIALGYTRIQAPAAGEVLQRLVDPGDLALPGKPLLILQTQGSLLLEAYVREGLIGKVRTGMKLEVALKTLDKTTQGTVEEIVPYADPQTRTFLVKAALPPMKGLYPGMFGKLRIPVQESRVVMIPQEAVRKVGQLELVSVKTNGDWQTRFIKTGRALGEKVEVLSGLNGGETLALTPYGGNP